MNKYRRWTALALCLLAFLSGCAPEAGLSKTGLVVALAVDPAPHGNLRWTFMFPNPTITPGNELSIKPTQAFFTLHTIAPTLSKAILDISMINDRQVYVGDAQVVVVNPQVEAQALNTLVASLVRMGAFPPRAWMALASPSAAATLQITMPEETVPTVFLSSYFNCRICHPILTRIRLWQAWDELQLPSQTAVLPWISEQHGQLSVTQSGWVTRTRIIRCNPAQTETWAIAMGRYQYGAVTFHDHQQLFAAQNVTSLVHHAVLFSHHQLSVQWDVALQGQWQFSPQQSGVGNQLLARRTLQNILGLINQAGQSHADPFGTITQIDWHGYSAQIPPMEVYVQCGIVPTGRNAYDAGTHP